MSFLESIMESLVGSIVWFKGVMIGDAGWGVYFLLLACLGGGLKYIHQNWTKVYNVEELKKKWFGLGRVLHWIYAGTNSGLKIGSVFGSLALCGALVASGASKNGQTADAGSPLTSIPQNCFVLTSISEQYNDTSVVYIKRITRADKAGFLSEKLGRSILIPPGNLNADIKLAVGDFLSVSLFEGQTLIGKLSKDQAMKLVTERNGKWWNKAKALVLSQTEMPVTAGI